LGRTKDQPQFDRRTIHGVARLTPHLRSAGVVQMRLDGAGEPFRAVLEGLPSAVLVLNRHGKPLFANHAAEVMLKERDGLSAENGRLTAATLSATAHLQAVIDRAIASQLGAVQTAGEDVILRRPSGKPPFAVHVAPLGRDNPYWSRGHRAAVGVFVDDPDRGVPDIAERLRAMFGLTEAEARVASALAEGLSPAEIAKRHGTQTKTVRTQLESIHAKLGVRRQAQAVQRILGVARSFRLQR
ncbi:MAG TPA: LuxR C-terminal-related transcriptional regulator, partial [bacterium]